jgi:hypothetical protein
MLLIVGYMPKAGGFEEMPVEDDEKSFLYFLSCVSQKGERGTVKKRAIGVVWGNPFALYILSDAWVKDCDVPKGRKFIL